MQLGPRLCARVLATAWPGPEKGQDDATFLFFLSWLETKKDPNTSFENQTLPHSRDVPRLRTANRAHDFPCFLRKTVPSHKVSRAHMVSGALHGAAQAPAALVVDNNLFVSVSEAVSGSTSDSFPVCVPVSVFILESVLKAERSPAGHCSTSKKPQLWHQPSQNLVYRSR